MGIDLRRLIKGAVPYAEKARKAADEHKAEILLVTELATGAAAVIMAGASTPKALYLRDQRKAAEGETKVEMLVRDGIAMAPAYFPTAVLWGVSAASGIACYKVQNGTIRTLASGLALAEHMAVEYQDRVVEKIGDEANMGILGEIAGGKEDEVPFDGYHVSKEGKILYFDMRTGHVFESSDEEILAAAGQVNGIVAKGDVATVNDFYGYLPGVDYTSTFADEATFSPYGRVNSMDVHFGHTLEPDGKVPKKLVYYDYNKERN